MELDDLEIATGYYRNVFYHRWSDSWYEAVLKPLIESAAINEDLRRARRDELEIRPWLWVKKQPLEPYEIIVENQIGLALVLCQSYITKVISQIVGMSKEFELIFKAKFPLSNVTKKYLMAAYSKPLEEIGFTPVEIIDALANYFKHHEESEPLHSHTARIVCSAGIDLGKAMWYGRNLSRAVTELGVVEMSDLIILPKIVDDWKAEIGKEFIEFFSMSDASNTANGAVKPHSA